jgi:hypothetical protein
LAERQLDCRGPGGAENVKRETEDGTRKVNHRLRHLRIADRGSWIVDRAPRAARRVEYITHYA